MVQRLWIPEKRRTTVCVDSYEDGILRGRFYGCDGTVRTFGSLSQFLVMMEQMLEHSDGPRSDTAHRSFSGCLRQIASGCSQELLRKGEAATFDLQILFRQHTSWQGMILWKEKNSPQSFRSALELILLMDSALREQEEKEVG